MLSAIMLSVIMLRSCLFIDILSIFCAEFRFEVPCLFIVMLSVLMLSITLPYCYDECLYA
jgi:hypothetical protein